MSLFNNLKTDAKIENNKDILGGGAHIVDTDVYPCTIKLAYINHAQSEAMSLNLHLETPDGQELRQTLWVTSVKAKGCKPFYTDKRGKNHYLPGYVIANDICLLTLDHDLADTDPEEKVIKLYDFDARQDMPQKKMVVTELHGHKIKLAIEKQTVDKNVKQDDGSYAPSGETREQNEIIKAFHDEYSVTVSEAKAGLQQADFMNKWVDKNKGTVRNKCEGGAKSTRAGTPTPAKQKSLFTQ